MNIWTRLLLAIGIGAVVGVGCVLIGRMFDIDGGVMGGVAGGLAAGITVALLRPKAKS
jgi:hypothetical protein